MPHPLFGAKDVSYIIPIVGRYTKTCFYSRAQNTDTKRFYSAGVLLNELFTGCFLNISVQNSNDWTQNVFLLGETIMFQPTRTRTRGYIEEQVLAKEKLILGRWACSLCHRLPSDFDPLLDGEMSLCPRCHLPLKPPQAPHPPTVHAFSFLQIFSTRTINLQTESSPPSQL